MPDERRMKCPACKGTGERHAPKGTVGFPKTVRCWACMGRGYFAIDGLLDGEHLVINQKEDTDA